MNIEQELKAIWDKYGPQREAEQNAARVQEQAARSLRELNDARLSAGLCPVVEYSSVNQAQGLQMQAQGQAMYWSTHATPKTWRDEMNESMLATIRRHFT